MAERTDDELIARAAANRDAFAEIVRRHQVRVYNHCTRMVGDIHAAEDLAQEAFVRAYLHLDRYDPAYKFANWLLKIATNLCLQHLRGRAAAPEALEHDPAGPSENPEEVASRRSWLQSLLARLAPLPRTVFLMFHHDGYSIPEISEALALPVGTVKTHLHRSRLTLARAAHGEMP